MADNHSKTSDGKKSSSGLAFRTNCRMLLNLRRDKDASAIFSPDQPLTPITDLAVGFSNLSTLSGETPKRCLDLSNLSGDEVALQNFVSPVKMPKDRGDSTNSMCIQTEHFFTPEPEIKTKKCHKKKVNSILPRLLCSTPSFKTTSGSHNYPSNKENESGTLKNPGKPYSVLLLREAAADVQLSPTFGGQDDLCTEYDHELHVLGSPIDTVATCVDEDKEHFDGFTECLAMDVEETAENTSTVPANLSSSMAILLSGPFLTQDVDVSNVSMNRSRLYRSPSMPEKLDRPVLKRAIIRLQENETPVKMKRRRSTNSPLQPEANENCQPRRRGSSLKKTLSLCDVDITKALDEDYSHRQLIGDFSKVYALPTVTGRHQDLRYITAETMAALINGEFNSLVETFYIVDCRYPYEFEGGHIQGALNLHRADDVLGYFLKCPLVPSVAEKRIILVFHCEFSTERGPKMSRFLREEDRARNDYPNLYYPEVYLLKGGYREFFPEYKTLCEPQSYCPMHHQDYRQELLKCRTKSKSWAGERKRRDQIARLMKL